MSVLTTLLSKFGPVAKQVLGTFAPTILKAVGGPFGALAGTALQAVFGTSEPTALDTALNAATPDQIVALKKAELDFQLQIKQLGIQEEDLTFKDIEDARAMQVAVKANTPAQLAWLVIGGFLLLSTFEVVAMTIWPEQWGKIPPAAAALLGTIFGYLLKAASGAETFYFGSSASSQAKDQTLADIAKQ